MDSKANLIQLPGAPEPGSRYICQKCGEEISSFDLDADAFGQLRHQGDVDADADGFFPVWCGPVFEEKAHDVEECSDPRCEDPACIRQRNLQAGERRADAAREGA